TLFVYPLSQGKGRSTKTAALRGNVDLPAALSTVHTALNRRCAFVLTVFNQKTTNGGMEIETRKSSFEC
ncbi:hypothetical protein, partial [Virgibacillus litoralis]|uniref:hypothetical protein n=1 Tax=Virgibacillus litoralis TaxID=578221 RepID=UPI001AE306C9